MSPIMLLQVIFIVLKVLNLVDWGWGRVFIPMWAMIGAITVSAVLKVINERH